jgi:hypothetical protein
MFKDYAMVMQDSAGRIATLYITGASIADAIAAGATESQARESAESNAFANAIAEGLLGDNAWIETYL